jgi:hypothetical protein
MSRCYLAILPQERGGLIANRFGSSIVCEYAQTGLYHPMQHCDCHCTVVVGGADAIVTRCCFDASLVLLVLVGV